MDYTDSFYETKYNLETKSWELKYKTTIRGQSPKMCKEAKILKEYFQTTQQLIKRNKHHDQVEFMPEIQGWF